VGVIINKNYVLIILRRKIGVGVRGVFFFFQTFAVLLKTSESICHSGPFSDDEASA